jgi:hypothetical protein
VRHRAQLSGAWLALSLVACRGQDAYLGGSHAPYTCSTRCQLDQGAPSDAGDWFINPEAELGDAPSIVYPLDGSVHPQDLGQLTVQFKRGRSDFSLFRVRFELPDQGVVYDFFTPCLAVEGDGCRYLLSGNVWDAARAELVEKRTLLSVTGSTASDGVIKSSAPIGLKLLTSTLQNKGFYYWSSVPVYSGVQGDADTGIFRLPFGADRAEPFIMPRTDTNKRECAACHSVSRDGSTIAFTARNKDGLEDQRSGVLVVAPSASPNLPFVAPPAGATYDSSMMALSSNGTRVLVAYDDRLVLRSSAPPDAFSPLQPGDEIVSLTRDQLGGKIGYFPEFSPDDQAVVLTLSDTPDSAIAVQSGDIAVLDFNALTTSFAAPRIIVPGSDSEFHFYPTWSPNGDYIAFASAPRELGEDGHPRKSYDQKMARLRLVSSKGGAVTELVNATQGVGNWSTFPKIAPFESADGKTFFMTFNSKISYGLIQPNETQTNDAARVAQLWMSAIETSKLSHDPAQDPSSAPIWLPFQDATQSSHLGIWTKDVKCRTDVVGGCAPGQRCGANNTCQVMVK